MRYSIFQNHKTVSDIGIIDVQHIQTCHHHADVKHALACAEQNGTSGCSGAQCMLCDPLAPGECLRSFLRSRYKMQGRSSCYLRQAPLAFCLLLVGLDRILISSSSGSSSRSTGSLPSHQHLHAQVLVLYGLLHPAAAPMRSCPRHSEVIHAWSGLQLI